MLTPINIAILQLIKRAEHNDPSLLQKTFVDTGALAPLLASPSNQLIYGRRGTGKTHALIYAKTTVPKTDDLGMFIDLRSIGSNASIYADTSRPLKERATRLLLDVLEAIHDRLVTSALERGAETSALQSLDLLAAEISQVKVDGDVTVERSSDATSRQIRAEEITPSITTSGLGLTGMKSASTEEQAGSHDKFVLRGRSVPRVHFAAVAKLLEQVMTNMQLGRLWLFLDEWSVIPLELQPFLADMLRRCIFPVPRVIVKIAAIEQRSAFKVSLPSGDYLGFELGADIGADIDLDDFMVFGNNKERSIEFFSNLIYNHVSAVLAEIRSDHPSIKNFISATFTQEAAFAELVRACEGVPRDAIHILGLCAQKAGGEKISIPTTRDAARTWYQRDKENPIPPEGKRLLIWVVEKVIRNRKARAFLLERQASGHGLIELLTDLRVLHLVKKGISAKDQPGMRFDAYAIDYGCYVDLLATKDAPQFLFEVEDGVTIEVPKEDYRSIRRAVLDLEEYQQQRAHAVSRN